MVKYTEKEFKSILNKYKFIDSWFWGRYGINCYNGCRFACVYCDSRSNKYYLPGDFGNDIIIKKNAGAMLSERIRNARALLPDVVVLSGSSDPYQPAEKIYNNTLQCLEVLLRYRYPVHIITKSDIVLRDACILNEIAKKTWACVSVTITSCQPETAGFLEERAPGSAKRLGIITELKKTAPAVQTGVLIMPVVPFISDSLENIEKLFKSIKEAGADYVLFGGGMTMRDSQALWFLRHLEKYKPELIKNYEKLYRFSYNTGNYTGTYTPSVEYSSNLSVIMVELCEKYRLPYRIKRFIPGDYRKHNYRIAEILLNSAYYRQLAGKAWKDVFWAGQNIQNLKEPFENLVLRNNLTLIKNIGEEAEMAVREYMQNNIKNNTLL